MTKKFCQLLFTSVLLWSCNSQARLLVPSQTATATIPPEVVQTQLAQPVDMAEIDSVFRISNDFLAPPTPIPSATPTNVFYPVTKKEGFAHLVITLQRGPCFGSCPVFSIAVYGNGTGVYEGKENVKVQGIQNFHITDKQLAALVQGFDAIHYFSLLEFYSVNMTDVPVTATSIAFQGHSKIVGHAGGCTDRTIPTFTTDVPESFRYYPAPQKLCDLEQTIEEILNTGQWTGR